MTFSRGDVSLGERSDRRCAEVGLGDAAPVAKGRLPLGTHTVVDGGDDGNDGKVDHPGVARSTGGADRGR